MAEEYIMSTDMNNTNESASDILIDCDGLVKIYKTQDLEVMALQGLDLTIRRGELLAIIGNPAAENPRFSISSEGWSAPAQAGSPLTASVCPN